VSFPPEHEPPRIVEPGKEPFDDRATLVAPQAPAALRRGAHAVVSVGGNQVDAEVSPELGVRGVAVMRAVPDQARRVLREEPVLERRSDEPNFIC
jgi:hypothetical protein